MQINRFQKDKKKNKNIVFKYAKDTGRAPIQILWTVCGGVTTNQKPSWYLDIVLSGTKCCWRSLALGMGESKSIKLSIIP